MAPTNALGIVVLCCCMLFPLVEASFCGPPPLPTNAAIRSESSKPTSSGYNKGTLILYTCKPGFQRLSGLVFVKCLGTTWTKSTFICVASKKCRSPRVPKHGKKFGSAYSVGQRVRFSCDTGFVLQGAAVIECLGNKTWSKAVPTCKVVDCGSLSDPTHGRKIKETKTTFGGRADFICRNKRYSIVGSRRRFCQANGEWSGKPTLCKDYSKCGERKRIRLSRMVGGVISTRGMWPWQAGLYRIDKTTGREHFLCGAALIDRQWIITAAHCFMYTSSDDHIRKSLISPPEMYKIKVGDTVRTVEEASQRVYFATKINIHPQYHDDYKENDIALVKLSFRVTLTQNVRKVCLPQAENSASFHERVTPEAHGFVAGWGSTQQLNPGEKADPESSSSEVLRSAQFQIQDSKLCQNSTDYHFNDSLEFCAGSDRDGIGPCMGDSGGPFVMRVLKGGAWKWVAVGLVSWGEGCGIYGRYTFYTRLAPYIDWIDQHVRK